MIRSDRPAASFCYWMRWTMRDIGALQGTMIAGGRTTAHGYRAQA